MAKTAYKIGYGKPPGNRRQQLNLRQRTWLKLYTGKDPDYYGNATACYKAAYGVTDDRSAQTMGSRLRNHPIVQSILRDAEAKALEEIQVNAGYVLKQSVRLLDRAMGDEAIEHTIKEKDPETGIERVRIVEKTDYDPATAKAALQLIGQHKDIQAFTVTVEHNHTHHLEQRLAARSQAIEAKATRIDENQGAEIPPALAQPAQGEQDLQRIDAGEYATLPGAEGIEEGQQADVAQKGSIGAEVKSNAPRVNDAPARESDGATGK